MPPLPGMHRRMRLSRAIVLALAFVAGLWLLLCQLPWSSHSKTGPTWSPAGASTGVVDPATAPGSPAPDAQADAQEQQGAEPPTADDDDAPWVETSTNATLGFGHIYAISQPDSPRRQRLLQAANVTQLDLTIPKQPEWTDDDERNFRLPRGSSISRGSLLAWLGHIHALRQFLDSGAETALFLEDDVDWDIHLRTTQAPLTSQATRQLLGGDLRGPEARRRPYGDPTSWDLLYLGHCGDYWHGMDVDFVDGHVDPTDLEETPHLAYGDPTMPGPDELHPFTSSLLRNLGVPDHTRLVHRSVFPLCTFGYALSRTGARRLLKLGSREPVRSGEIAYDVLILHGCRDYGLRCLTINPELFHHQPGASIIDTQQGHKDPPPVDLAAQEVVEMRGETPNINCGFWDGYFSFNEDDPDELAWLQEEVGRKGRCLKEGRDLVA